MCDRTHSEKSILLIIIMTSSAFLIKPTCPKWKIKSFAQMPDNELPLFWL